jgi:ubiquinone/menaquinone biosynthesis C-methylase UbiE
MLNRRSLFAVPAAAAALVATAGTKLAEAAAAAGKTLDVKIDPKSLNDKERARRAVRINDLNMESVNDFLTGMRKFVREDVGPIANFRSDEFLASKGVDNKTPMSIEQAFNLMLQDPVYAWRTRLQMSTQQLMWRSLMDHFHGNREYYLAELEKTDKSGPGKLELNPDMKLPDYTRHEIHIQPGGYVGDPFAGFVYHNGTKNFYFEQNDFDEIHTSVAQQIQLPQDGKVMRVLDLGCGVGQLTTALKDRFPQAEVWGLDVGGPMVRYAHYRAVKMGTDVNFAQRLAEDTKFPDQHFDVVTSYIMFHEVTTDAAKQIVAEAHRVLRPGGVFMPFDFLTVGMKNGRRVDEAPIINRAGSWMDSRFNGEPWSPAYRNSDFPGVLRNAGFQVSLESAPVRPGMPFSFPTVLATKTA